MTGMTDAQCVALMAVTLYRTHGVEQGVNVALDYLTEAKRQVRLAEAASAKTPWTEEELARHLSDARGSRA